MKSSSKILILAIFLVFICCVSAASAVENDNVTASGDELAVEEIATDDVIDERDTLASSEVDVDEKLAEDSPTGEYVIYVGSNTGDGNGSESNPYKDLDLAYNSVKEYKSEISVKISDGIYNIGSQLKFNTSVLHIEGVGNAVVLKNSLNTNTAKQSFGLTQSGNFTMSNIIFDGSGWTQQNSNSRSFTPFDNGENNHVTFYNCTFRGFHGNNVVVLPHSTDEKNINNEYQFISCRFINITVTGARGIGKANKCNVTLTNCVFQSSEFEGGLGLVEANSVILDRCWFGYNDFNDNRMFTNLNSISGEITLRDPMVNGLYKFTKYAIFAISENYLGDNKYEIIGKLMWNDTTTDDIDKLGVMTVYLNSTTGVLNQTTAILENGIFKVLYTSTSSNNTISAVLDNQKIDLNFTSIDMSLNAPNFVYGDNNQNITITLSQTVYGAVTVIVNGIKYGGNIENNTSIVIPITDTLSVGSHNVNVTFIDEENHIYAFNTTTITVNKVSNYDFNATVTPTVYLGDNATVTLSLPDGATGNVTVKVGENAAKLFDINDIISINGFVAGNNTVNITFISDNYETKSIVKYVTASTRPTTLSAPDVTTDYNVTKDLVITLTSGNEVLANKTVNVVVGSINKNITTDAGGKISIDISNLDPNTYTATISFAGDELYNSSSTTATVVVREDVKTDISIPSLTAGKAATTTIKLPEKATGNITLTVDGKIISVVNLTNGSATITIPELTAGKHDVVISYSGDGNYAGFSQNSTVTVKEQAKPTPAPATVKKAKQATKIVAKKKTFKAKTKVKKYTITLKTKAGKAVKKVQVTIKIGKKTFKAKTNSKGKATFKIKKLTKKAKYTATIKFKGNANYKAVTKKVKITIK